MTDVAPGPDKMAGVLDRLAVKLMYGPVRIVAGMVGGWLASMVFTRIWRAVVGRGQVPQATDRAQSWADILPAAALHGIVFAVVKTMVDRAGAKQFERMTGQWPGKDRAAADDQP